MNLNVDRTCVDPITKMPLSLESEGLVSESGAIYPIVRGIPRFVSGDNYAAAFGIQWNEFPRTQLDSFVGAPISESRLARVLGAPLSVLNGALVLEAGSGAGRFTEVLLKYNAVVHSFDFSMAVEANAKNNGANDNLTLVQGNILSPPFPESRYDFVICLGVVQHTPNSEQTIDALWQMVRPGGTLLFDHYDWGLLHLTTAVPWYRAVIKRLPKRLQRPVTDSIVSSLFPLHWRFKDSKWAQRVLRRISPVHFYYPHLGLSSKTAYYDWARLDTHDATTDHYKHRRSAAQIRRTLEKLGATDIDVRVERLHGNGIETKCRKPEK
ncbi:MAG TPA: class I SAM-dependent methyltransferase [Rhizomicrobium sp.]